MSRLPSQLSVNIPCQPPVTMDVNEPSEWHFQPNAELPDQIANAAAIQADITEARNLNQQFDQLSSVGVLGMNTVQPVKSKIDVTLQKTWICDAFGATLQKSEILDNEKAKRGLSSILISLKNPQFEPLMRKPANIAERLLNTISTWKELADDEEREYVNVHHEFVVADGVLSNIVERRAWKTMFEFKPGERLRRVIKSRMAPSFYQRQCSTEQVIDLREKRAHQTLRRMIGERQFYTFRRRGFVSVKGASGKSYVLFPGNKHSHVYFEGKHIHDICVIFQGDYCPTDSLIMRFVLILADEEKFCSLANIHQVFKMASLWPPDLMKSFEEHKVKPLKAIFDDLKQRAIWEPKVLEEMVKSAKKVF